MEFINYCSHRNYSVSKWRVFCGYPTVESNIFLIPSEMNHFKQCFSE